MPTATSADGTRIAYDLGGSGPDLVLVHGTATVRAIWAPIFQRHFTTLAVDRRGRGDSEDNARYSIEREFDDVAAVADTRKGRPLVFGHSFGGLCALGAAAMLTDRVAGLVLYEPPYEGGARFEAAQLARLEALVEAGDDEAALRTFHTELLRMPSHEVDMMASSPAWPDRVATVGTIGRELRAAEKWRFQPQRLERLDVPVLLLTGSDSPSEFTAGARQLQELLPKADHVVMRGQQHIAMYTGPELLVAAVVGFARKHGLLAP